MNETMQTTEDATAARGLRWAGEAALALIAFGSAWPFGSVDSFWESVATAGVSVLMILWAAYAAVTRSLNIRFDWPTGLLAGLILVSGFQLIPLPKLVVGALSPSAIRIHEQYRPAFAERMPGEAAAVPRSESIPLSLDPTATKLFAARIAVILMTYLAVRNWLASWAAFRRFAWAGLIQGTALAAFAIGQYFSSKSNVIFWNFFTNGAVFGPFVCRNHYPDYLALCAGAAWGLISTKKNPRGWLDDPTRLAGAAAFGLMVVSILFSLSRGGVLALGLGGIGAVILGRGKLAGQGLALALAGAVGIGFLAWYGTETLEKRFTRVEPGHSVDDRTPLWRSTFSQYPGFWCAGAGQGTHMRIEPLGRDESTPDQGNTAEHAHNDYLEALVEGGPFRLAIALALPLTILIPLGRSVRKYASPALLGAWFGLAVVAVHAAVDFALHIPAVVLLTATVAAFAGGRLAERRTPKAISSERKNWPALAPVFGLAFAMLLLAADAHNRQRGDRYFVAALASGRSRPLQRIDYLNASLAADARNPDAHYQLAQAHLEAAVEADQTLAGAVAGPVIPRRISPPRYSPGTVATHIVPALQHLRISRELCPLLPEVHARFGILAGYCESSEPALVHFERARSIFKTDGAIWFACGIEAARTGDRDRAKSDWKRSLELNPKQLKAVLREARMILSVTEIQRDLLPDDPEVLLAAAEEFPVERRAMMERAAGRSGTTAAQWNAIGTARFEVDRIDEAKTAWEASITANGDSEIPRQGLATMFETEERYAEALPHLEWLSRRRPKDDAMKLRYRAALHGAELQRIIGE